MPFQLVARLALSSSTMAGDEAYYAHNPDDNAMPDTVAISSPADGATVAVDFTLDGTATPGATVEVLVDGVSVGTAVADENGAWSLDITVQSAGMHNIEARVGEASDMTMATVDDTVEPTTDEIIEPVVEDLLLVAINTPLPRLRDMDSDS